MKPVEIVCVIFMGRGESESPVAVDVDYILDAGGRFRECKVYVLDYRCRTEGVEIFNRLRREEGGALCRVRV
jgi:hypothetical protein